MNVFGFVFKNGEKCLFSFKNICKITNNNVYNQIKHFHCLVLLYELVLTT